MSGEPGPTIRKTCENPISLGKTFVKLGKLENPCLNLSLEQLLTPGRILTLIL